MLQVIDSHHHKTLENNILQYQIILFGILLMQSHSIEGILQAPHLYLANGRRSHFESFSLLRLMEYHFQ